MNSRTRKQRSCAHTGCTAILAYNTKGLFCGAHRYASDRGDATPAAASRESFDVKGDTAEVTKDARVKVRSLADLIAVCEIDTREWEVERWVCNKWESASVPVPGQPPVVTELYQVKAWLKKKVHLIAVRSEVDDLLAAAKKAIVSRPSLSRGKARGVMVELNIPDAHFGKLAWSKETGHQDYDIDIAKRVFRQAVATLLERVSGFRIEQFLIPIGSDMLNTDNKVSTTTRGTLQDVDSRIQKSFVVARELSCEMIDAARSVAPVVVLPVPGNHDELLAWTLGHSLECYYHKTAGVTIDNAPTLRKYHEWGKVMLMLTHGDKGKAPQWPLLMASEQPEMFGRTKFREVHVGHLHQTKLQEWNGIRVRTLSSLSAPDAWHAAQGYVGNLRSAEAFVWDRSEGLITTATFTLTD